MKYLRQKSKETAKNKYWRYQDIKAKYKQAMIALQRTADNRTEVTFYELNVNFFLFFEVLNVDIVSTQC